MFTSSLLQHSSHICFYGLPLSALSEAEMTSSTELCGYFRLQLRSCMANRISMPAHNSTMLFLQKYYFGSLPSLHQEHRRCPPLYFSLFTSDSGLNTPRLIRSLFPRSTALLGYPLAVRGLTRRLRYKVQVKNSYTAVLSR